MIEEFLDEYRNRSDYTEEEIHALHNYFFQLFMREGTSEYAIMMLFTDELIAHSPLFTPSKLAQPGFPVPVSIVVGEHDWVTRQLKDTGENLIMLSKMTHDGEARYWTCPDAGHNMQLDNPNALANIILHDIFAEKFCRNNKRPILTAKEYADYHFKM